MPRHTARRRGVVCQDLRHYPLRRLVRSLRESALSGVWGIGGERANLRGARRLRRGYSGRAWAGWDGGRCYRSRWCADRVCGAASIGGGPVGADTVFRIASVTKTMTAIGVMQLQDEARLSLDDAVNRHISGLVIDPPAGAPPVTFKHLLTHTAGIGEIPRGDWRCGRRRGDTRNRDRQGSTWLGSTTAGCEPRCQPA